MIAVLLRLISQGWGIENVGLGDTVEATYWPQFKDEDPLPANSIVNVDDLPPYAR